MHKLARLLFLSAIGLTFANPASAVDPPPEELFRRLHALADNGNADVKYNLGMFLNNGIGTPPDNKAAFRFFAEAAGAGHLLASYKVGCYYAGQFKNVVSLDEKNSLKFKLPAAEAGYDLAQYDVAMHYGSMGDVANALMWWEKASRQAHVPSTAYLANYYSRADSSNKPKGLALMLILKYGLPSTTKELSDRIATISDQLSDDQKEEAARIRASWLIEPTPITAAARAGISAVPALLSSLER